MTVVFCWATSEYNKKATCSVRGERQWKDKGGGRGRRGRGQDSFKEADFVRCHLIQDNRDRCYIQREHSTFSGQI